MLRTHVQKAAAIATVPCLLALLWQDARAAVRPSSLNLQASARVGIQFERSGNRLVPVNMKINGTKFAVTQKNGRWGVAASTRDLIAAAPALKEELDKNIAQFLSARAGELAATGKSGIDSKASREDNLARHAAEAEQLAGRFNTAYENVLDQQVFAMPYREWRLIEEQAKETGAAAESEANQKQNQAEEEEPNTSNNFWVWLGALVLLVATTVAPLAALVWLASTAVTLASVATAVVGVTLAFTAGLTFYNGMRAIAGAPLWEYYSGPGSGPQGHYGPR